MNAALDCPVCHKPVDLNSRYAWQQVTGWERKAITPSRRHGSDIMYREPTGQWAHGGCVSMAKQGLLGQTSMLGSG